MDTPQRNEQFRNLTNFEKVRKFKVAKNPFHDYGPDSTSKFVEMPVEGYMIKPVQTSPSGLPSVDTSVL